jgi:hypothetical protein
MVSFLLASDVSTTALAIEPSTDSVLFSLTIIDGGFGSKDA